MLYVLVPDVGGSIYRWTRRRRNGHAQIGQLYRPTTAEPAAESLSYLSFPRGESFPDLLLPRFPNAFRTSHFLPSLLPHRTTLSRYPNSLVVTRQDAYDHRVSVLSVQTTLIFPTAST